MKLSIRYMSTLVGGVLLGFMREMGLERRIRKQSGGLFSRRGRVLWAVDASRRDVDTEQKTRQSPYSSTPDQRDAFPQEIATSLRSSQ